MRRTILCLLVMLMALTSVSANAIADEYDFGEINVISEEATPYINGMFRTCTKCGAIVYLFCNGGRVRTYYTGCDIPSHNPANENPCRVEHLICGTSGYCKNEDCEYSYGEGVPSWP